MKLKLSGRNSKILLSTTNFLIDQGQKYLATLEDKKSSSIKKIVNTDYHTYYYYSTNPWF